MTFRCMWCGTTTELAAPDPAAPVPAPPDCARCAAESYRLLRFRARVPMHAAGSPFDGAVTTGAFDGAVTTAKHRRNTGARS